MAVCEGSGQEVDGLHSEQVEEIEHCCGKFCCGPEMCSCQDWPLAP